MSTTALEIIELVRSLPSEEQRAVREALATTEAPTPAQPRRLFEQLPDGTFYNPDGLPDDNPDGLPDDNPFFAIMADIEAQRHSHPARPLPSFE